MKYNFTSLNRPLVCAYISKEDPFSDKRAWSGLIYKIRESIEKAGVSVKWVPFSNPSKSRTKLYSRAMRLLSPLKDFSGHTIWAVRDQGQSVDTKLLDGCDFIFIPSGGEILPYIDTKLPSIIYGDATFKVMTDYYFKNISKLNYKHGIISEKKALDCCTLVCKASNWAIDSVVKDYGLDRSKCDVLEFGANLEEKDIIHINTYEGGALNVLFSGVEWERKGADIAIEAVGILRENGIDAKLLLCGIKEVPSEYDNIDFVEYIGFLNKNFPDQYNKYIEVIKRSHIFLLPTKAECAGIVFSEASAYGLPIYTYDTGGIGDYVKQDINGYRLPLGSSAKDFAEKIMSTLDSDTQKKLQQGCFMMYEEHISWNAWSRKFRNMLMKL